MAVVDIPDVRAWYKHAVGIDSYGCDSNLVRGCSNIAYNGFDCNLK